MKPVETRKKIRVAPSRPYKVFIAGRFYRFVAWLYRRCERRTCICKRKNKFHRHTRCLGVKASQAFIIYLIQIAGIGFIGSLIGAVLGVVIQQFLPFIIKDFLPVKIATTISWTAVLQGMILGIIISVLFALLPLLSIRKISPLNALRVSFEPVHTKKDSIKWVMYILIILFVYGFTYMQMGNWKKAFTFTVSIAAALLLLTAIARALMWLVRRFFPSSWSYLWRQGLGQFISPQQPDNHSYYFYWAGHCTYLHVVFYTINFAHPCNPICRR